jgi:hypothetical protein
LDSAGSPWAVRWFSVRGRFTPAKASAESLDLLEHGIAANKAIDRIKEAANETAMKRRREEKRGQKSHSDWLSFIAVIAVASLGGFIVGRYYKR